MKRSFGSNGSRVQRINVTPMMNLVAVLIPFLIATASFTQISGIDVNLPGRRSCAAHAAVKDIDELNLSVLISDRGFTVAGKHAILPTLPKSGGAYPYKNLRAELIHVKSQHQTNKEVTLTAEPDIDYEVIVAVMDICRETGMPDICIGKLE